MSDKIVVLLLSGKAESGKDTFFGLADGILKKENLWECKRLALGDNVKRVATTLTWDGQKDAKGRTLLQWLGDGARAYNEDVWIHMLKHSLLSDIYSEDFGAERYVCYIVTDCRYPNEIEKMKAFSEERGFSCHSIRVDRKNHVSSLTAEQLQNTSEVALDTYDFDIVINNDSSLKSYKSKVRDVLTILER